MPASPSSDPVKILAAPRCHLGEGPCYDPRTDTAWWVDILERRLFAMPLAKGEARSYALPVMVSAVAAVDEARHLLAAEDGLHLRDLRDGRLSLFCPLEAEEGAPAPMTAGSIRAAPSGSAPWGATPSRVGARSTTSQARG